MAVSIADIQKIRKMTGAGLADCKKALTDAEGDFDKAVQIIREKGQAIAAKRSDRETSNGCVLVKADNGFSAMIALKCETDFVANGKDFIALTQSILDAAVAAKAKTLDEVKALPLNGSTVQDEVIARSGITGEQKEIIATVSAEKAANLPQQMIENIAKGRLGKFLKEVCLLNQEDIMDGKKTVREVLAAADPELKIVDFKRFTFES